MRRNLVLLNLLLLALIGLAGWRLSEAYKDSVSHQAAFLHTSAPIVAAPVLNLPPPPAQVSAANYYEIAAKLPFSKDRNPTVVVEVAAAKQMPLLPRYYGMMSFGGAPRVVLAPVSGGQQKSYLAGDRIGEFRLVEIAQTGLVFEWDGKQVPAPFEQMRDAAPAPQLQQQQTARAADPPPSPSGVTSVTGVTSVASTSAAAPGKEIGESLKGCQAGDKSPSGTVVDGYRKVVSRTPFGESCRWEKVN